MAVGDFGIALPITLSGATVGVADEMTLTIRGGGVFLEKTFSDIQNNTIQMELTEEESAALPVGTYEWSLDWYQGGVFMCNIIPRVPFKVVSKV